MEAGANNFIMAPYCWIARFTLGNVLPVARDLPISHIYGIKISAAALVAVCPVLLQPATYLPMFQLFWSFETHFVFIKFKYVLNKIL